MEITQVKIEEGDEKIVLFEASNGKWYVRADGSSHERTINWFANEMMEAGLSFEVRGGACISPLYDGYDSLSSSLSIYGKSVYYGPIQDRDMLNALLTEAFPDKEIDLKYLS